MAGRRYVQEIKIAGAIALTAISAACFPNSERNRDSQNLENGESPNSLSAEINQQSAEVPSSGKEIPLVERISHFDTLTINFGSFDQGGTLTLHFNAGSEEVFLITISKDGDATLQLSTVVQPSNRMMPFPALKISNDLKSLRVVSQSDNNSIAYYINGDVVGVSQISKEDWGTITNITASFTNSKSSDNLQIPFLEVK